MSHRKTIGVCVEGLNEFYSGHSLPLIFMQLQIINILSFRIVALYLIGETHHENMAL